ncbi:tail fiber assembly protein [Photorhabdus heterorhabditis]|uniref:Tail fiber assembly protein n=1 Tax=Photorhabdus heterorhabditis TaxID=880156 RepID=A0A5B0V8I9_9GAMM|nr:tail fiber assembly protein [Photorhabdus heterorhabditis]
MYRVLLNRIDVNSASDINWPEKLDHQQRIEEKSRSSNLLS